MKRLNLAPGLALFLVALLHSEPGVVLAADGPVRLPGHVPSALTGATPVPAAPGADAEPLTLTVVLKRTDQAGFDGYLREVYALPGSATFSTRKK
jgi:hypothetical protein